MTDRELLEKAAKAAGIDLVWNDAEAPGYYSEWRGLPQWEYWNPLVHDGVAMRLAVRLDLLYDADLWERTRAEYCAAADLGDRQDPYAATRRAIVRAAAATQEKT